MVSTENTTSTLPTTISTSSPTSTSRLEEVSSTVEEVEGLEVTSLGAGMEGTSSTELGLTNSRARQDTSTRDQGRLQPSTSALSSSRIL